ncbi:MULTISPECIES: hypothetical protein [unclassified Amycolatopsis]|uniref:hypothetical protein n=1 Tax=unclassified Amycolatopsis TaxID=2618356 RepID=UPI002E101345|nr:MULTISPECIES: hypothetical protein [unclassified Amycolatopsis]WSJ74097.1 hypothetical protein OG439_32150 [Amycolatopsis sp. NBC_01307]WSK82269.1 hypothetical protein OG570_17610 [Amycolatopsis sp. NBC_01286]
MDHWLTIEVFDGESTASLWRLARGDALTEAALTNGAEQWVWHEHRWGVVLEIEFRSEESRDAFRALPVVTAALDAVPDPARGLLVYPGRGGGAGTRNPRRPRPKPMSDAGAVPVPVEQVRMGLADPMPPMFSEVG